MIPPQPQAGNGPSNQERIRSAYSQVPKSGKAFGSFAKGEIQAPPVYYHDQSGGVDPYAPLQNLSQEERRKLSVMQGHGLHVAPPPPTTSGEYIYLQNSNGEFTPCRRCGITPAQGIRWVFDGEIRFKCNNCGKHMKMGLTGDAARESHQKMEVWDRIEDNRKRAWREQDSQRQEEMSRDFDDVQQAKNPFISALRDKSFVMGQFFA